MNGLERFQSAMLTAMRPYLLSAIEQYRQDFEHAIKNRLFNLKGPRVVNRALTPKDRFLGKMFGAFNELQKSFETLEDIAFYVARFPYRNTRVTPERHLQFCVEAYLNEVYLLQERLLAFVKLVERQYKKDKDEAFARIQFQSLADSIRQSLKGVVGARATHVHEVRFTDPDIDRLSMIALLSRNRDGKSDELRRVYFRLEYDDAKGKWRDKLSQNNKTIRSMLDMVYDNLYGLIFETTTGELRIPKRVEA